MVLQIFLEIHRALQKYLLGQPVGDGDDGVDDLDGSVKEERIYHMAGARTPEAMTPGEISSLIKIAGRVPVERDTLYNVVSMPTV